MASAHFAARSHQADHWMPQANHRNCAQLRDAVISTGEVLNAAGTKLKLEEFKRPLQQLRVVSIAATGIF